MPVKNKFKTFLEGGELLPINFKDIPFKPKRVFVVSGVPSGTIRGRHAHKKTKQVIICLSGVLKIKLVKTDGSHSIHFLDKNEYLFHDKMEWGVVTFVEEDTIMLSICSTKYDRSDYIEDLERFLNYHKGP